MLSFKLYKASPVIRQSERDTSGRRCWSSRGFSENNTLVCFLKLHIAFGYGGECFPAASIEEKFNCLLYMGSEETCLPRATKRLEPVLGLSYCFHCSHSNSDSRCSKLQLQGNFQQRSKFSMKREPGS